MTHSITIADGNIRFANDAPLVLIGGMNVLESRDLAMEVAEHFAAVTQALGVPYVFKASFDKANRSSIHSFRGPGLEAGLTLLADIKARFGVPILTDVHEIDQCEPVAAVADIIQLPAFLARQTNLVTAMAKTDAVINVKKPQFLAPHEMRHIINKFAETGNDKVLLCERGSSFGYGNLVVDMLGMDTMKAFAPVIFDVTHALQKPGGRTDSADGRGEQAAALARCGVALGISGIFVEAHPDPAKALCDGPSALRLDDLHDFLIQLISLDNAVKGYART